MRKPRKQFVEPPYYRVNRVVGAAFRFRSNPVELLSEARQECGQVVRIRLGYMRTYLFFKPEHIKRVLQDNQSNYVKAGYSKLEPLIGHGLLSSEGENWRKQRTVIQPAFHRQQINNLVETMVDVTDQLVDRWDGLLARGQNIVDLELEMTQLTLSIVSRTLFGYDVGSSAHEVSDALRFVLRYGTDRIGRFFYLPESIPTRKNRRYKRSIGQLDSIVHDLIERRLITGDSQGDLLDMMLADVEGDGSGVATYQQLRDQIMTFLSAGHETTAMALTWTFYLMHHNPDKAQRVRAEVKDVLGGRTPSLGSVASLPYTTAVLKESMRLYPPVWGIARRAREDDVIGDHFVPKKSRVIVSPYVTHRDPEVWEEPETFWPERWLNGSTRDLPKYAWFPFGGGQRQCVGRDFALTEATIVLAMLADRFSVEIAPWQNVQAEPIFTLKPADGMDAIVSAIS